MLKNTHTRLLVRNFAECFRFYQNVLGLTLAFGGENDPVYAGFKVANSGMMLGLYAQHFMSADLETTHLPTHHPIQDGFMLSFEVEDVDTIHAELVKRGAPVALEPVDRPAWGMRTAHYRDPDGNLVEIYHDIPME